MRTVEIDQLRDGIVEYLSLARSGETILISDHAVPVAHLAPPPSVDENLAAQLTPEEKELVAAGLMRPRKHLLDLEKLRNMPKACRLPENAAMKAVIDDRNESL